MCSVTTLQFVKLKYKDLQNTTRLSGNYFTILDQYNIHILIKKFQSVVFLPGCMSRVVPSM